MFKKRSKTKLTIEPRFDEAWIGKHRRYLAEKAVDDAWERNNSTAISSFDLSPLHKQIAIGPVWRGAHFDCDI